MFGLSTCKWKMVDLYRVRFTVIYNTSCAIVCTSTVIEELALQTAKFAVELVDGNRDILKASVKELASTLAGHARNLALRVGMATVNMDDREAVFEWSVREAGVQHAVKAACKKNPKAKSELMAKLADVVGRMMRQIREKVKVFLGRSL